MESRHVARSLSVAVLALALGIAAATPLAASAAGGPAVTIATLPASPDGQNGWFVTEPALYATVSENAELGWGWDSVGATMTMAAGTETYVADAPEGIHSLTYTAVGPSGSTFGSMSLKTDATPPTRPTGFVAEGFPGPGVSLAWDASTDAASGISRYAVYRDTDGPPFTYADEVADTTETDYHDAGRVSVWRNATGATTLTWNAVTEEYRYAVRAIDHAGNESLLTEAQVAGGDVAGIVVMRSVDGAPYSAIATLGVDVTAYTDLGAEGGTVLYVLRSIDADGAPLSDSAPAPVLADLIAPPAPAPLLAPVYSADGAARFLLTWPAWTPITDEGSGIAEAAFTYGAPGSLISETPDGVPRVLTASDPTAYWTGQVSSRDVAGNASASVVTTARNVGTTRIEGPDRLATSRAVAEATFTNASTAVFASSLDFPDALAASSLAGAVEGPVILVGRGPLPSATRATLAKLGVTNGYVIGGDAAVQPATYASIDSALAGSLTRVWGRDRYATAAAVAGRTISLAGASKTAFVVSGTVFADALSAGPAAYVERAPILFASEDAVPAATLSTARDLGSSVVIVGGYASVAPAADSLLDATRIAGADRFATSRAFADWAVGNGTLDDARPVLATGANFPDGLSAAPLAGAAASPLLLVTDAKPAQARSWLTAHRASLLRVRFVGGDKALSNPLRLSVWSSVSVP